MNVLIDIGINLLVALISFGLGWAWQKVGELTKFRGARRFWKPFVGGQVQIVVPRSFRARREQMGKIGAGTANGLIELSSYFRGLRVDDINVKYADLLQGDSLKSNLILIGGPLANVITKEALEIIKPTLQFRDHSLSYTALYDTITDKFYETLFKEHSSDPDLREVREDHAMILKAVNPFDERKLLLVIAGNFDYGTWAAIRYVMSEEFIGNQLVSQGKFVEALIEADILRGSPQRLKLVVLRELSTA